MIGWLKRKIAWAVAGRELAELERWRVECGAAERWLAEFPDVRYALDYVKDSVLYGGLDISRLRDQMRRRRDATPLTVPPINLTPDTVDQFTRAWRAAYGVMPLIPPPAPPATELDAVEQYLSDLRSHEHSLFVEPPAPTHYTGIFPASAQS
jgi:hypothetical protein